MNPKTFRVIAAAVGPVAGCALLFAGLLALMRVVKPENVPDVTQWWVVLASDALIAGLGTWGLAQIGRVVGVLRRPREPAPLDLRSRWRPMLVLFLVFAAPLAAWFVGEWPGHPYYDEHAMFEASLRFETQPWLNTLYSVYAVSILRLFHQYTALCVINIALLSWVLADFFSLVLAIGVRRGVVAVFATLLATSIPLGFLAINMTHDILAAFLKIALTVSVLKIFVRGALLGTPGATGASLFGIGALVLLTSSLRNENLALLAYIPLMLLVTRQARWVPVLVLAACLGAGTLLYRGAVRPRLDGPKVLSSDLYNRYRLCLLIGPVGFMIKHNYYTPTPEEDRKAVASAIDYDLFLARYHPFDITYIWGITPEVTDERLAGLRRVYLTSALNNPGLFLANRLMVLMRCVEGHPMNWYPFKPGREKLTDSALYPAPFVGLLARHGMTFEREHPGALSRLTHRLRDWSFPAGFGSPGYYIWNALPVLVMTVLAVLSFRRLPVCASVAGIIAAPLALFALAAPVGQFKYITDLYVFGFLIVPLALLELGPLRQLARLQVAGGADARQHAIAP